MSRISRIPKMGDRDDQGDGVESKLAGETQSRVAAGVNTIVSNGHDASDDGKIEMNKMVEQIEIKKEKIKSKSEEIKEIDSEFEKSKEFEVTETQLASTRPELCTPKQRFHAAKRELKAVNQFADDLDEEVEIVHCRAHAQKAKEDELKERTEELTAEKS